MIPPYREIWGDLFSLIINGCVLGFLCADLLEVIQGNRNGVMQGKCRELPLTTMLEQPTDRELVKQGIVVSERCKESAAELNELLDDLWAEAKAELVTRKPAVNERTQGAPAAAKIAEDICAIATELNTQTLLCC